MFHHEGEHRTEHHNQLLAGYLAFIAGCVNSAGFIMIGSFTSHVTGNVGRLADDVALGNSSAAVLAATMVTSFFAGAFVASMAIESNVVRRKPHVYGALLLGEAALLASFYGLSYVMNTANPRFQDTLALLLCTAMGMQNSLVTRMSGAVTRTTHLTGVVTDLGIEGARWFRYWRARVGERTQLRLTFGSTPPARPHAPKSMQLLAILISFMVGSAIGALLAVSLGNRSLLLPLVLLTGGGLFALLGRQELPVVQEARK